VQYPKRLGLAYTLRRRPWLNQILTLFCAIWTEPKDGPHVSRKSALTGSRTCVAGIACVEASSLTILPSRSFSRPIHHTQYMLKVFVACGAYAERRTWYLLSAKYRWP
jgi:hypothetical protein